MLYTLAAESVSHGPAATESSLEMQHLRPHPHLLNQTLHLIKIPGDPCVRVKDVYDQQLFLEKNKWVSMGFLIAQLSMP